ncbi:MAG TPA: hypothetical protein PK971_14150 [Saprospiraceae bacterium]|nr:hypothetical protein [Saprospiraceae bacterium]
MMRFLLLRFFSIAALIACSVAARSQTLPPAPESSPAPAPRPFGLNISGPTLICKGSETILKAEGDFESFKWSNGSTDRFLRVREEGLYEVTAKTKGGCTYTSSVRVQVKPCI